MDHLDNQTLARLCRVQAKLASTAETRSALLDLADLYEASRDQSSVVELMKALPKQPK